MRVGVAGFRRGSQCSDFANAPQSYFSFHFRSFEMRGAKEREDEIQKSIVQSLFIFEGFFISDGTYGASRYTGDPFIRMCFLPFTFTLELPALPALPFLFLALILIFCLDDPEGLVLLTGVGGSFRSTRPM